MAEILYAAEPLIPLQFSAFGCGCRGIQPSKSKLDNELLEYLRSICVNIYTQSMAVILYAAEFLALLGL